MKRSIRRWDIRKYLLVWISAILFAFVLLCSGLLYATAKLHSKTHQIYSDGRSLQAGYRFELAVLSADRDTSLWRLTRQARYQQQQLSYLRVADANLQQLVNGANTREEVALAKTIKRDYLELRRLSLAPTPPHLPSTATGLTLRQPALEDLLVSLDRQRELNTRQLTNTMLSRQRLDGLVGLWLTGLIITATFILILGGIELWSRIFKPTLALSSAATEFGEGNLQVRAPVFSDDEMGALASTFNTMAQAICDREKERLDFVATVAHDLKTPLVIIGGGAYLLQRKDLAPDEREEWLANIIRYVDSMEAMIADLTDAVQLETGRPDLHLEGLDLSELARKVAQTQAAATSTHVLNYSAPQPCPIRGDRKRLERVVLNLVSNAIKYSPTGRAVTLHVEPRDGQAILSVVDAGIGIAPEDLPKLFAPFARLDRTRDMAKGTGLGLSSVKKIVEAHNGQIDIASRLGVGTTVTVTFPLAPVIARAENRSLIPTAALR